MSVKKNMYKSYESFELLASHDTVVENLNQISLRWDLNKQISTSKENDESVEFLVQETNCAVADDQSNSISFIKVCKLGNAENNCKDDYNHSIMISQGYLQDQLQKQSPRAVS